MSFKVALPYLGCQSPDLPLPDEKGDDESVEETIICSNPES